MNTNEEYMLFAKEIAIYAGKIMLKYFNENNEEKYKADETIVTKADTEINNYLIEQVRKRYPNHAVSGEEEKSGTNNYTWVCDPIDGTAMYARHIPIAVFSLALVVNGKPQIGIIYDPFTKSLYSAIKGNGAYKNDIPIHVNNHNFLNMKTVVHYDMWNKAEYNIYDIIKELDKKTYIVSIGSITHACAYIASGEFSLAIFPGTKEKYYDIAAAKVIVEEAGGKVTDLFGNEQRYDKDINGAIISNNVVHEETKEIIIKYIQDKTK